MQIQSDYSINFNRWNFSPIAFQGKTSAIRTEIVLDRLEKKIPVRQIAAEFGIGLDTFYKMLRERNIPYKQQNINNCKSVKEVCETLHITKANYSALMHKYNVETPYRRSIVTVSAEQILEMRKSGKSVHDICLELQISESSYHRILQKAASKNMPV